MAIIKTGIQNMIVRIANMEDTDQIGLFQKHSNLMQAYSVGKRSKVLSEPSSTPFLSQDAGEQLVHCAQ